MATPLENNQTQADRLSRIILFDEEDRAIWPADELKMAMRRQLDAALDQAVGGSSNEDYGTLAVLAASADPPIRTFADLLGHPRPPVDLLWMVKDMAKLERDAPHSLNPPDVTLLFYYAAIILGMIRWGQRITTLGDDELRKGLNWGVRQTWIGEEMRGLLLEGLRFLRLPRSRWRK